MSSRTEEFVISKVDRSTKLFCRTWHPATNPTAALLIVHGYLEHGGRYRELGEYLASEHGIAATAYDLRGHGKSSGQRGHCASINDFFGDLETVLEHIRTPKESNPPPHQKIPVFVLAHSFGGLLFLDYARDKDFEGTIAGAIVMSPFVDYADHLSSVKLMLSRVLGCLIPRLSLPVEELPSTNLTSDVEKQKEHGEDPLNLHYFTVGWALEALKAQARVRDSSPLPISVPILYFQAEEDRVSDPVAVDKVGKNIQQKDKTIVSRKGEMHEILNEVKRKEAFQIIGEWIVQRAK